MTALVDEEPIEIEVRRNGGLSAGLAGVSALVATAYFARAASTGSLLDWGICAALAVVATVNLLHVLDARSPLLVADNYGMRVRKGRLWRGVPWSELDSVLHQPRRGLLRDGRVVLDPGGPEGEMSVRLGLATRVIGATDLTKALTELAAGQIEVLESEPGERSEPASDGGRGARAAGVTRPGETNAPEPTIPIRAIEHAPAAAEPTSQTVVIAEVADLPVVEPDIGPALAAARTRLRLSVDQLAERTRIRPHVIEAIEIDDFAPCGGDFYARGHLRTLARVLGVDVTPLLATYDKEYADAPIDPRTVFEAELATGRHGSIRSTRGGPSWSVLVAAVMAVVLAWSIARLVTDHPVATTPAPPSLANGSAGLTSRGDLAAPVPVVLTAAGGGARVVLRDGGGNVIYTGPLAFGESQTFNVSPPVRVQSTDGSVEVTVDGQDRGALGKTGQPAQDLFTAR